MEKIEIKNFVGIKDMTLEIRQINILIGSQATGKSIIAKLLFYFKSFIFEIVDAALEIKSKRDLDKNYKQKFEDYFPPSSWGDQDFTIRYSLNEEFVEISKKKIKNKKQKPGIVLRYSNLYKEEFIELRRFIQEKRRKELEAKIHEDIYSKIRFANDLKNDVLSIVSEQTHDIIAFKQLYIPAGRSFFAHLKSNIFTFLSKSNAVDPFLIEFGTYYEFLKSPIIRTIRNRQTKNQTDLDKEIEFLSQKILCGKYLHKDGEDYLEVDDGRQISLTNSSSGQQETLPLTIILRNLTFPNLEASGNSVYIEEPEAHIFPSAQRDLVELIATVYNVRKDSLQFLITTHSPYILTSFNNLLQAGILATDATEEKIKEITNHVPKTRFLHPKEVAVYSLENGYCQSIIDEETGLINTNIIDEVSNELAIQFDELLDIEE